MFVLTLFSACLCQNVPALSHINEWPGQLDSQLSEAGLKTAFPLGCYVACREMLWKCREEARQRVMWFDGWQDEHVFMENSL